MSATPKVCINILILTTTLCAGFKLPSNGGRIIGGAEVNIEYFPHQVSLQILNNHVCGGSVVSADIILTAAHCVTTYTNPQLYNIRAGSAYTNQSGVVIAVKSIKAHESYNQPSFGNNDIAVVKLAKSLTYSTTIKAIPLLGATEGLRDMTQLLVSGWGYTDSQIAQLSTVLRYTIVSKLPQTTCENSYKAATTITTNMFCAGDTQGGHDSCQGDSGGPLVAIINNVVKLVGVVSFGLGCGTVEYPGVYTRAQNYNTWLTNTINAMT